MASEQLINELIDTMRLAHNEQRFEAYGYIKAKLRAYFYDTYAPRSGPTFRQVVAELEGDGSPKPGEPE